MKNKKKTKFHLDIKRWAEALSGHENGNEKCQRHFYIQHNWPSRFKWHAQQYNSFEPHYHQHQYHKSNEELSKMRRKENIVHHQLNMNELDSSGWLR